MVGLPVKPQKGGNLIMSQNIEVKIFRNCQLAETGNFKYKKL